MDNNTQKLINYISGEILDTVFKRVEGALTVSDLAQVEGIDKEDKDGQLLYNFLKSKIPNLDLIIEEEFKKAQENIR